MGAILLLKPGCRLLVALLLAVTMASVPTTSAQSRPAAAARHAAAGLVAFRSDAELRAGSTTARSARSAA